MRTEQEICEYYRNHSKDDMLGFEGEVLLPYLSKDLVREFVKPDADLSAWIQMEFSEKAVLEEMKNYVEFAWTKVINHRGISARRSVEKMSMWLYILEDDEMMEFCRDEANYQNYGAPVLKKICEKYGFSIPEGEDVQRMSEGKSCIDGCTQGCCIPGCMC